MSTYCGSMRWRQPLACAPAQVLTLTLEKTFKSVAPKFDFWRALVPGHPEIDTHKLTREGVGAKGGGGEGGAAVGLSVLQPGQLDAYQMGNMGVRL